MKSPGSTNSAPLAALVVGGCLGVIRNRAFDEIAVGDSASISRTLAHQDIQLFAVLSGDVNPRGQSEMLAEIDDRCNLAGASAPPALPTCSHQVARRVAAKARQQAQQHP